MGLSERILSPSYLRAGVGVRFRWRCVVDQDCRGDRLGRWAGQSARAVAEANCGASPAKVLTDLAVSLALGWDCLAAAVVIRSKPDLYGKVGSEATISRAISALAVDTDNVLKAVAHARRAARARAWGLAFDRAPNQAARAGNPLIVDLDATLVTAHSDKEHGRPDVQTRLRFPPLVRSLTTGRTAPVTSGDDAATGHCRLNTAADDIAVARGCAEAVARSGPLAAGPKSVDPHRRWWRHEAVRRLARQAEGSAARIGDI